MKGPDVYAGGCAARAGACGDEFLLRVRAIGSCSSDLNTYRGFDPLVAYPRVPGHGVAAMAEGAGRSRRLSSEGIVGHRRAVYCPRPLSCLPVRPGNACYDNQTLGVQRDGALEEWIAVPWSKVLEAEGLSLPEVAPMEPLSVGFHAAARARVSAVDRIAVAAAARRGASVVAVDIDDRRLEPARGAGATHAEPPRRTTGCKGSPAGMGRA